MRKKAIISMFGCLILSAMFLTACEISTRPTEICDVSELPGLNPVYPRGSVYGGSISYIIDDLRPSITWALDEEADCAPAEYLVEVWGVDYDLPGEDAWTVLVSGRTEVEAFPWPTSAPDLLPARTYLVVLTKYGLQGEELEYGGQSVYYFSTGPLCSDGSRLTSPSLFLPLDRSTVDPDGTFAFDWTSEMTCWPDDGYSLEISTNDDFSDLVYSRSGIILQHELINPVLSIPWEECEYYYWRVRAESNGGTGPYSETRSILIRPGGVICPLELGPVITPLPPVSVRISTAANCRSGPSLDFPVLSTLPVGGEYEIDARNTGGDSWRVIDPSIGSSCWVNGSLVEVFGDTSQVDILDPTLPPTETPAPFNCAQYNTDWQSCSANPACKWDPNNSPSSPCMNK